VKGEPRPEAPIPLEETLIEIDALVAEIEKVRHLLHDGELTEARTRLRVIAQRATLRADIVAQWERSRPA
jgi:cobalamin biosynthesis protein CobD/CbiB